MTTTTREADLIESVADALHYISYYHPMDHIRALGGYLSRDVSGCGSAAAIGSHEKAAQNPDSALLSLS